MKKQLLLHDQKIRILLVDDSIVVRRLVKRALQQQPFFELVGTAANGTIGLQKAAQLDPDVIILDVEMPEMSGLELLQSLRKENRRTRVIMHSTRTEQGAEITVRALTLGADDYITKDSDGSTLDEAVSNLQKVLFAKIMQFFEPPTGAILGRPSHSVNHLTREKDAITPLSRTAFFPQPKVLAIGTSTGGPTALFEILSKLPENFPLPILIVQHMPPLFTKLLAERLNASCQILVEEATHGREVLPGSALIAPGDYHMTVAVKSGVARVFLDQTARQSFCRPAVDALFVSVADIYEGAAVAILLTGMGQDGLQGASRLKTHGARILAQDEATSVVWGMPGAVVNAGIADSILPLQAVAPALLSIVAEKRGHR